MSFHYSHLPHQWQSFVKQQASLPYFQTLQSKVNEERQQGQVIYPQESDVFNAFIFTDVADVKVVILGQDPYHGAGQAHGLAFSVEHGVKVPPSLVNMYKELTTDIADFNSPQHGNLTAWAQQGVMLLNTVLTVKEAQPNSHAKYGWQTFTDSVIKHINEQNAGCVFVLWGANAHKKAKLIDESKHCILSGPHPSPLSAYRGFFGCQHFSKANQWLEANERAIINWCIE